MFNLFANRKVENFLQVDIHSHLLPGIDDGVKTWEESIEILKKLSALGFKKIVTTPHVISDYYPNDNTIINSKLDELSEQLKVSDIDIQVTAAAEYMVDESFLDKIDNNDQLMCIGDNYVLIETPFINRPMILEEVIFKMKVAGYQPILAHPERYIYLQDDYSLVGSLIELGLMFQVNLVSLNGYYSKGAKKLAEYLIDNNMIHFIGSDIHNMKHAQAYEKAMKTKYFEKCRQLFLYNNTL